MESTNERKNALESWLFANGILPYSTIVPMQHDASFRRYFRVATIQGSRVVMDASSATENCHSYIVIAKALREHGLQAPEIFAADTVQGFLLISDFGNKTYLSALNDDNADQLYAQALTSLSALR